VFKQYLNTNETMHTNDDASNHRHVYMYIALLSSRYCLHRASNWHNFYMAFYRSYTSCFRLYLLFYV